MPADDEDALVLKLLMEAAIARRRAAQATLNAYAANALPKVATEEDLQFWRVALQDAEDEIARLSRGDY